MHPSVAKQRLKELSDEVARRHLNNTITHEFMDRVEAESEQLETAIRTYEKAKGMFSYASPAEHGFAGVDPDTTDTGINFKGFMPNMENRIRPVSMYEFTKTQLKALQRAAQQNTPLRVHVHDKGIESGNYASTLRDKAAVDGSGFAGNLLPPVQQPTPYPWFRLPYEPERLSNFLPNIAMDGPGVGFFRHTGNAAESAYTAPGALKPDLSPSISEVYVRPAKVAGRCLLTKEVIADAGDQFVNMLVADLTESTYNAEANLLINGTSASNGFDGLLHVSGTQTRAYNATNDTDALGTLNKAMVDLRSSFFQPDLLVMSPAALGSLRRLRDANGRLQLDLLAGARNIDQTSDGEELWGCRVIQTQQIAADTAILMSVQAGAAALYIREALNVFYDPYSQSASNIHQFICELRCALAVPRPNAINVITGLPTT
ncbi:MAG TPA: phage major capsid protein [Mycobacterium sp.]|uniref:phage major capsid protein n=1 Tax=Mycobacterium sp. TaxID=1785 RepID=UPI002D3E9FB1|nr:phage major capsid protein [Mycobacterium sp.]HZU46170.1 phage major capsid protein [Mycobacterium sp.]